MLWPPRLSGTQFSVWNDPRSKVILESDLNIFFDANAAENLNIQAIYTLGAGLVIMFEKLALRHG